jgi:hypothetical protein
MARPQPIHKRFQASYNKRGLQPSVGEATPISNTKVEYKQGSGASNHTGQKAAGSAVQAGGVAMQAAGKGTKAVGQTAVRAGAALSSTGVGAIVGAPLAAAGAATTAAGTAVDTSGRFVRVAGKKVRNEAKKRARRERIQAAAKAAKASSKNMRVRATRINTWVFSACAFVWLWVQLPFAILNTMLLAALLAIDGVEQALVIQESDSLLTSAGKIVVNGIVWLVDKATAVPREVGSTIIESVLRVLDMDPTALQFDTLFMITYGLIIGIAAFQFAVLYLVYKLINLEPFGGSGSGLKMIAFLLALIGYCIPLFNLLPWIFVWTFAVWLKPK